MLTLSTTMGYAVSALSFLADPRCRDARILPIARGARVPAPYLAKIVRKLARAGILGSKRGVRGGIWLARPPEKIRLLEVLEVIEGEDAFTGCMLGHATCSDERDCPVHKFWKSARRAIRAELQSVTLADVVAFNARRRAQAKGRRRKTRPAA